MFFREGGKCQLVNPVDFEVIGFCLFVNQSVIERERRGDYLGKTVQVMLLFVARC